MKTTRHLPQLAIIGIGYLVSLVATFTLGPPAVWQYDVVAPTMSAAALMLLFSPSSGGPEGHERFLSPRMAGGAYALKNGTKIVVSRGLARESTPLPRFFNHPEEVIANLKPKM